MPRQNRRDVKLFDFSRGLFTKKPKETIPHNSSPYCKNVLWDEKDRVSKIFGTSLVLAEAYNAFLTNPVYNLYNYTEIDGSEVLIIQGVDTTMKLWKLRTDVTAAEPIDITPTGVTLAVYRQCHFANHKGLLYVTNGCNDLLVHDANSTVSWRKWHVDEMEKFRYLATHNYRLWAARSVQNPIRVIYSGVNEEHFGRYYGDEGGYVGSENWLDFPTLDGTPVTGICEFQDSMLVFKPNHVFRVFGDATYGVTISTVVDGLNKGCIAHESIVVYNDRLVYYMSKEGIMAYGHVGIAISPEDQKVQTVPNLIRVTSEIDDYWTTNMTTPNIFSRRALLQSGATDLGNFVTTTNCSVRTPTISTHRPSVVTMDLAATTDATHLQEDITGVAFVDVRSIDAQSFTDSDRYCAQIFTPRTAKLILTAGVPFTVDLYLRNQGTLTSTQKINVYVTATKTDTAGDTVPDTSIIYAEGQRALDDITTSMWASAGGNGLVTFDYWDFPQTLATGTLAVGPDLALVIKAVGDTTSLYVKWGYPDNDAYAAGQMMNSDKMTPTAQSTKDYTWRFVFKNFEQEAQVVPATFHANDSDFVHWDDVFIEMDPKTANSYARRTKLVKLEYDLSDNGSSWSGYVTANSWRDIQGTKKYIRFKLTFRRASGTEADENDSFTLISVKATYTTQATSETLVKGIMWDNRYLLCAEIADSGG